MSVEDKCHQGEHSANDNTYRHAEGHNVLMPWT